MKKFALEGEAAEFVARNAALPAARFEDVDLAGASFEDVNLAGARFVNVNLAGVAIEDANLDGMTISGVPVRDLLAAYAARGD